MQYLTIHTNKNKPSNKYSSQVLDESIIYSNKIKFPGVHSKYAEYIRFKSDLNTFKINEHIYSSEKWSLKKPQLILSITGPRRNFTFRNTRMKKAFKRGLIQVTQSIDSFVITNGANSGISKYVGEAISEIRNNAIHKPNLIGILIWNTIAGREVLTNQKNVIYGLKESLDSNTYENVFLDPNHSHFIFVDDATNNLKTELNMRNKIENEIRKKHFVYKEDSSEEKFKMRKYKSDEMITTSLKHASNIELNRSAVSENKSRIPLISILVNGEMDCLLVLLENITRKVPTLLLSGSRGATDLICQIITNQDSIDEKLLEKFIDDSKILKREKYSENYDQVVEECKNRLREIEKHKSNEILHIFKLDDDEESDDFELAILRAFLNSQKSKNFDNLKLALQWGRIDIAKTDIFTDELFLDANDLAKLLEIALVENKPDFVELFLQNGANLDSFLTLGRLYYLYNSSIILNDFFKRAPLFEIYKTKYNCEQDEIFITFKKLKNILKKYTLEDMSFDFLPRDLENLTSQDELSIKDFLENAFNYELNNELIANNVTINDAILKERVKEPGQNLFIWAILLDRIEIAKVFWQFGQYQMGNALLSSILLKNMSNLPQSKHLMAYSNEFVDLAIGVQSRLDTTFEEDIIFKYLAYKIDFYGFDCLQIAFAGNVNKFMSQLCVQRYLDSVWLGHVKTKEDGIVSSIKLLISCVSFGFLAPILLYDQNKLNIPNSELESTKIEKRDEVKLLINNKKNKRNKFILSEKSTQPTYWQLYADFMHSPRTHFTYIIGMFLIFLGLFSYLLLCEFKFYKKETIFVIEMLNGSNETNTTRIIPSLKIANPHYLEYILLFWIFTFSLEEFRQFLSTSDEENVFKKKLIKYLRNNWNYFDISGCLLFLIGISFRFIALKTGYELFVIARITLCIDLIIWYLRLLHVSTVFKALGPKLVMIQKMINDLLLFMILIIIFVFCFGVATHAALYPGSDLNFALLRSLFTKAYWPVYGTIKILEDFDKFYSSNCKEDCPEESGVVFSYIVLMFYMVIANVLLLNLLIAMFSSTYNRIQENTDCIWKFQRYKLVYEYRDSPMLPPPFSILAYIWNLIDFMLKKFQKKKPIKIDVESMQEAQEIEKKLAEEYLEFIRKNKRETNEARLKLNVEKLEVIETKLNAIIEFQSKYFKKFI